jgi:hypothetical protein
LSNLHLGKISSVVPKIAIASSFDETSKNPGVSLVSLDPSKEKMHLFHHPKVFGDSWSSTEKQLVAILGTVSSAIPVEVISKLVTDFKLKSHSIEDFSLVIDNVDSLVALVNPKINFHCKNLVLIPNLLTKTLIQLKNKTPLSVASAFFVAMLQCDTSPAQETGHNVETLDTVTEDEPQLVDESNSMTSSVDTTSPTMVMPSQTLKFMDHFIHVLQFCHLCHLGKISPVLCQVSTNIEVKTWFLLLKQKYDVLPRNNLKHLKEPTTFLNSSEDESNSSPENRISKKEKLCE